MMNEDIKNEKDIELYNLILKSLIGRIPIVGSVLNELWNYFDADLIDLRLKTLEELVEQQHIDIIDFQRRLLGLSSDEHKFYAVRNNLKHMLITALPETVDMFNKALIELIMTDNYDMSEHACEIIQQLNADDIYFLKLISTFQKDGRRNYQQEMIQKAKQVSKEQASLKETGTYTGFRKKIWLDRNIQFAQNTIFWVDFAQYLGLSENVTDPGRLLNCYCCDKNGNTIEDWIYLIRTLTKLQSLGVLVCEIKTSLGTTSLSNVDRVHLTFFGQKIISYLDKSDDDCLQ